MGIMNFLKIGGKHYVVTDKSKLTQREALKQIFSLIRGTETDEPLAVRSKFEKIDIAQYTDAQVLALLKQIKAIVNQKK